MTGLHTHSIQAQHTRYRVTLCLDPDPDQLEVWKTRDLSLLGLFMRIDGWPELGSRQIFTFAWGGRSYTSEIIVVRINPDGIGVEFCHPEPRVRAVLDEITAECDAAERLDT